MTSAMLARTNVEGADFTDTMLPAGFAPPD
jgi:hypothetical protein